MKMDLIMFDITFLSEDKQASEKTYILALHVYIWYIKIYSCDFIHLALGYESDAFDVK